MTAEDKGSVTHWLGDLKNRNVDDATRGLWQRYFGQLVRLARTRIRATSRGLADEEDVALSAFDSFCRGAAAGRFPQLGSRDDLWRLLVTITARKGADLVQRERALRRGGGRVVGETAMDEFAPDGPGGLDQMIGQELSPQFAALVADECRRLLGSLRDDVLRQVALLRMEGYENAEIAERLGCGLRTVERKLDLIRRTWLAGKPS